MTRADQRLRPGRTGSSGREHFCTQRAGISQVESHDMMTTAALGRWPAGGQPASKRCPTSRLDAEELHRDPLVGQDIVGSSIRLSRELSRAHFTCEACGDLRPWRQIPRPTRTWMSLQGSVSPPSSQLCRYAALPVLAAVPPRRPACTRTPARLPACDFRLCPRSRLDC